MQKKIYLLAKDLGDLLAKNNLFISTAESCTGGRIAGYITDVPHSSNWFTEGFVTYSNAAKIKNLHVDSSIISVYGAVSKNTVEAMCKGLTIVTDADVGIAVSGIAGPTGATAKLNVGAVWLAWFWRLKSNYTIVSEMYNFAGNRQEVRDKTAITAFTQMLQIIKELKLEN